jgi:hypothetical protein
LLLQTLKFHNEVEEPVDAVVPIQKFSQLQSSEVVSVSGVSRNTVFNIHWDPRQKGDSVIVKTDEKYSFFYYSLWSNKLKQLSLSLSLIVCVSLMNSDLQKQPKDSNSLLLPQIKRYRYTNFVVHGRVDDRKCSHFVQGDIVAGSSDGHIRLFQEGPLKRPKTHLNQLSGIEFIPFQ